jgi:hypothetical protein
MPEFFKKPFSSPREPRPSNTSVRVSLIGNVDENDAWWLPLGCCCDPVFAPTWPLGPDRKLDVDGLGVLKFQSVFPAFGRFCALCPFVFVADCSNPDVWVPTNCVWVPFPWKRFCCGAVRFEWAPWPLKLCCCEGEGCRPPKEDCEICSCWVDPPFWLVVEIVVCARKLDSPNAEFSVVLDKDGALVWLFCAKLVLCPFNPDCDEGDRVAKPELPAVEFAFNGASGGRALKLIVVCDNRLNRFGVWRVVGVVVNALLPKAESVSPTPNWLVLLLALTLAWLELAWPPVRLNWLLLLNAWLDELDCPVRFFAPLFEWNELVGAWDSREVK